MDENINVTEKRRENLVPESFESYSLVAYEVQSKVFIKVLGDFLLTLELSLV